MNLTLSSLPVSFSLLHILRLVGLFQIEGLLRVNALWIEGTIEFSLNYKVPPIESLVSWVISEVETLKQMTGSPSAKFISFIFLVFSVLGED